MIANSSDAQAQPCQSDDGKVSSSIVVLACVCTGIGISMVWTIIMCMCRTDSPHDEDISPSSPRFRKSEGALLPVHNSAERNDSLALPVSPQPDALNGARRSPSNASQRNFLEESTDNLDAVPEPVQNGPISIHLARRKASLPCGHCCSFCPNHSNSITFASSTPSGVLAWCGRQPTSFSIIFSLWCVKR